jgi:dienelactone hydrolase
MEQPETVTRTCSRTRRAAKVLLLVSLLNGYYSCVVRTVPAKFGLLAAWIFAGVLGDASAQTLQVSPNPAMVDDAVAIRVSGLQPGEHVAIQAELVDGASERWTSEAHFVADTHGAVDSFTQAPIDGSYTEVSGPGLIWSMRPVVKHVTTYLPPLDWAAQKIEFHLLRNGQQPSSVTCEQLRMGQGLRQIKVQGELHGILFLPAGSGPHPAVLVVGGSDGGVPIANAAWLASHGYVAFALAYFHYENLPDKLEAIPLEYFGSALSWLMKRPEVEADHIAVLGVSRGGELALQLGSMYPAVKAVVAYVPSNVRYGACCGGNDVPYAWTFKGKPIGYLRGMSVRTAALFDAPAMVLNAEIPIENTRGPILMIGGEDDGVWESSRMVSEAAGRLKSAHFAYEVEVLKYPHAGHRAGQPAIIPSWHGVIGYPGSRREMNSGGSAQGDAASSLDAIPKVLEFLRKTLEPDATGATKRGGSPVLQNLRLRLKPPSPTPN